MFNHLIFINTKVQALRVARRVRQLLNKPKGWTVSVWQNGSSWYWELINGPISLHVSSSFDGHDDKYWTLLSDNMKKHSSGCPEWTTNYTHINPNRAIAHQVMMAKPQLAEYKRIDAFLDTLQ